MEHSQVIGVSVDWRGTTVDGVLSIALSADRAGFRYLWIPEAWGLEAFSVIGYLLGRTEKIKIGPGVLNVYSRSAAVVGMACATLEQIAPHRFVLGVGSSGRAVIERWHGFNFSPPLETTEKFLDVVRQVCRGEEINGFRLFTATPAVVPEIYIGALGDKNLRLSARIADGAIVTWYPITKLSRLPELVSSSGEGKRVFAYIQTIFVGSSEEKERARQDARKTVAFYIGSMGEYYAKNLGRLGLEKNVKNILEARSAGKKDLYNSVDEELLDELSLIGTPEEIAKKIEDKVLPSGVVPVLAISSSPIHRKSALDDGGLARVGQILSLGAG